MAKLILTRGLIFIPQLVGVTFVTFVLVRLLPGVMGNEVSGDEESFENGLLEHPHYTRPQEFEGRTIPEVLTSGNHAKIAAWRREQAERLTRERRPDLLDAKNQPLVK